MPKHKKNRLHYNYNIWCVYIFIKEMTKKEKFFILFKWQMTNENESLFNTLHLSFLHFFVPPVLLLLLLLAITQSKWQKRKKINVFLLLNNENSEKRSKQRKRKRKKKWWKLNRWEIMTFLFFDKMCMWRGFFHPVLLFFFASNSFDFINFFIYTKIKPKTKFFSG